MTNPYPTTPQPNPWSQGDGFSAPPSTAAHEPVDVLGGASYPTYQQPSSQVEAAGWPTSQFPGAALYQPTPVGADNGQGYTGFDPAPEHPNATTTLVLGIISVCMLFVGFPVTGPIAWYLGSKARKEMRQYPGRYRESSSLNAGWVMGIISSCLLILGVLMIALFILAMLLFAFAV